MDRYVGCVIDSWDLNNPYLVIHFVWGRIMIPRQLKDPAFRFYLVIRNSKIPLEYAWNSRNNYPFFHSRLEEHILRKGNYGVCTGYGNLIVIDFDSRDFYNKLIIKGILPPTFTVLSAGKRLPHMYYILDGEMFKKRGIDINGERVCDIQAARCGVMGPGSIIGKRFYEISINTDIEKIDLKTLEKAFGFKPEKPTVWNGKTTPQPEKVETTIKILLRHNIQRTNTTLFKCPFHSMSGKGNLNVMPDGKIHCFHESKTWGDIHQFIDQYNLWKRQRSFSTLSLL